MPRPRLCRRISENPLVSYFKPQGVPMSKLEVMEITPEEMEAFRLRHLAGFDQQKSADMMNISPSTYQRSLYSASKKIARALMEGKAIKITKNTTL
jgi:predicted DNA-binding protein (UPF0251 family)